MGGCCQILGFEGILVSVEVQWGGCCDLWRSKGVVEVDEGLRVLWRDMGRSREFLCFKGVVTVCGG